MGDGIRIQPQPARVAGLDLRGRLIIVRDVARPVKATAVCGVCGHMHEVKTYHFQLDADGTVMVSTTIWDRLQGMFDHGGFEKVNVVSAPPDVHIALEPVLKALDFTPSLEG